MKRFLAFAVSVALIVTCIPTPVWASVGETMDQKLDVVDVSTTEPSLTEEVSSDVSETVAETMIPNETFPEMTEDIVEETVTDEAVASQIDTFVFEDYTLVVLEDGTCQITDYSGTSAELLIPSKLNGYVVSSIGIGAFSSCEFLTAVTLPNGLKEIGIYAFADCSNLSDIQISETVTTIQSYAFRNCKSLSSLQLPDNLTVLGVEAFEGCSALKEITIPQSLTVIPKGAFYNCSALVRVVLPETLTEIGVSAFEFCSKLEEINLPESITAIGSRALSDCTSLKSVKLPSQLMVLSSELFEGCKLLETVILPDQLKETSVNTFYRCEALKEIRLPDGLETIASGTFTYCIALEEVVIPDSVTKLEGVAFSYCKNLKRVKLPSNITELNGTFAYCTSLEHIIIPESVTVIGERTFYYCEGLLTVKLPAGLREIKSEAFSHCSSLESIEIPDGVTVIPYCGFESCSSLKHVKLPRSLEAVSERAFRFCPLRAVNLPEGLKEIKTDAFPNFEGDIVVPSSVTTFGTRSFTGNAVFYCDLRSPAAAYAIDNGIPIVERMDPDLTAVSSLNRDNSYFKVAVDGIGAAGNLCFTGQYEFKSGTSVSDLYLQMNIPEHLELQYETLTLDGRKITDFAYDTDGMLKIPLSNTTGVIRFQLRPMSYKKIVFYALLDFVQDGTQTSEILGTVYEMMPELSINAATETSSAQVSVSGVTIPGNTVTLLVDGVEKATAAANKIGDYTAMVDLGAVTNGQTYSITAETSHDGSEKTAEKTVVYQSDVPMLEDLIIYHAGQKVALSEVKGSRPLLTFNPKYDFEYCIEIDNPELVETVIIVSRRGREEKVMVADWDEERQAFVVDGRFDPNDLSYVPGDLHVEYIPKMEPVDFTNGFDYTSKEKYEDLPENWKNAEVRVNTNIDDKTDLSFSIPESDGTTTSFRAVSERTNIPEGVTSDNAESLGYTKITDANGATQFAQISFHGNEIKMNVLDFGRKTSITSLIKEIKNNKKPITGLEFATKTGKLFGDHIQEMNSYHELWSEVYNSGLDTDAQMDLMGYVGVGVLASAAMTSFQAIALVGFVAVAVSGGLFAAGAMAAYGIVAAVFGVGRFAIKATVQRKLYAKMLYHKNGRLSPRWAIDPSGYVYDAVSQKPIHGATVSVYWLPYDGTDETYWNSKPDDTIVGEKWDATEFSQENPVATDIEGHYAWDVPEGWWRVKAEHPDYQTTWSDWVPVPPPQTEVNIPMIAKDTTCDVHNEVVLEGKKATCIETGLTDGRKCSVCGTVTLEQEIIPATGEHTYTDDRDPTCDICGEERVIPAASVPMFRMYDPNSGEHFYSGSELERDFLVEAGWHYEGVGFNFPEEGDPVHRLYDPVYGEHLYTMDEAEMNKLLDKGWTYEGVAFNSAGSDEVPQYRLRNPNAKRGGYHFTGSEVERDWLIDLGWVYQGIGWYSCLE